MGWRGGLGREERRIASESGVQHAAFSYCTSPEATTPTMAGREGDRVGIERGKSAGEGGDGYPLVTRAVRYDE